MNKNGKKHRTLTLLAILICALFTAPALVNAQEAAARQKLISQVQRAIDIIREKYVDQPDEETLTASSLEGMLKTLDPHSDYLDPKRFRDFTEKQNSEYYGIGAGVRTINNATYVVEPLRTVRRPGPDFAMEIKLSLLTARTRRASGMNK